MRCIGGQAERCLARGCRRWHGDPARRSVEGDHRATRSAGRARRQLRGAAGLDMSNLQPRRAHGRARRKAPSASLAGTRLAKGAARIIMSIASSRSTRLGSLVATAIAMFALAACCEPHRTATMRTIPVAAGASCPSRDEANAFFIRRRSPEWGKIESDGTPSSLAVPIEQCCYLTRVVGPVARWTPLCYENFGGVACVSADLATDNLANTSYPISNIIEGPWRGPDLVVDCSYEVTEYDWADVCG
jgi:hypothetical protein